MDVRDVCDVVDGRVKFVSTCKGSCKSIDQSINQSINQSVSQSVSQSVNQSIRHLINVYNQWGEVSIVNPYVLHDTLLGNTESIVNLTVEGREGLLSN